MKDVEVEEVEEEDPDVQFKRKRQISQEEGSEEISSLHTHHYYRG